MNNLLTPRYVYFEVSHAVSTHNWIIEHSGGLAGIKDLGQIESPLEHIQNDLYYPEFEDKITHLVYSINKNHAFNDGNKRSSLALGAYFLEINGFENLVHKFTLEMENIVVLVADNTVDKILLHRLVFSILYEDEYPEELKLDLYKAIQSKT